MTTQHHRFLASICGVRGILGALGVFSFSVVGACATEGEEAPGDAGSGGLTTSSGGSAGMNSAGKASAGASQSGSGGGGGTGGTPATNGGSSALTGGNQNAGSGAASGSGGAESGGSSGTASGGKGGGGTSGGGGKGGGGTGGGAALSPELTDVSTFTPASCAITPTVTPAAKIGMVGIATFTTDLASAERAIIQFGKTTEYTLEAPVNWADPMHETLLLGMPANTDVHYRVVVIAGDSACIGEDATFKTGAAPMGAPANQTPMKGTSSVAPSPGFIVAQNGNFSYIVNKQGEVVWAYRFPIMLTRSLMSWDGNFMFARDIGPFNAGSGGAIYRVGMDGEGEMKLPLTGGTHHDFTVTPTGIAYPAKKAAGECDNLYTADNDGSNSKAIVDLGIVFDKFKIGPGAQAMEECHVNAVRYYSDTDSFSFSDREKDAIAFVSASGEVLGSIGATPEGSTPNHVKAEGADSTSSSAWRVQHHHELYEPNKIVLFSNGNFQGGVSRLLHYTINGATATLDWEYDMIGKSPTFSGAQHLPNGNFMGTASQTGDVHEIDPQQALVQSFPALCRGGYSFARPTLYGRPPGR